ncbi:MULTISPECIES: YlxR family protein [unclassified Actinomyces]|uniref:YlxR family protein n=1 Tax=unclassified Actinomyces TaxID=2609248 RepID=UPI002018183D|nr:MULTISPECIES: YlxR family protein [unclassified Actinomyces]
MTVTSTSHVPVRTCVGCRGRGPRAQLLRLVLDDGGLAVDPRAVAPGRGAWIHPDPACLELAERRGALGRALRTRGPLDAAPVRDWLSRKGSA